ncbi:MAG: O-antigen ligase family protein [Sulfitobacter sp.]
MKTGVVHNPVLGPGFSGPGAWGWVTVLLGVCFGLGLAFTYSNPVMIIAGLTSVFGLIVFIYLTVTYPLAMLCIVVASQILIPVYVRFPFNVPPPLFTLGMLMVISTARMMLNPVPSKPGKYEHLIATVLVMYNVALVLTIPNEHASAGSYKMYIQAVFVPTTLFFFVLATVRSPQQLLYVFRTITIAAVLCGLLGLHEFTFQKSYLADIFAPKVTIEEDFFLYMLAHADEVDGFITGSLYRVYSFFTQPLEYSAFMVMSFSFAALMFVTAKTGMSRILYGLATGIIFLGFIVSFSRGPTLALGIVILFLGVFEPRVRPWILAGTAAAVAGVVIYWSSIVEKLSDRITGSENITMRFSLWKNGLSIFRDNPVRGIGYGSYPNYHVDAIRENQIGPMYEYPWPHIERVTTVENIFVSLAAETGLLGLSFFALVLGINFFVFQRIYKRCHDELTKVMALSAFGACLAYLLSGMTVSINTFYTTSILFFGIYIAALAVLSRELPDDGTTEPISDTDDTITYAKRSA